MTGAHEEIALSTPTATLPADVGDANELRGICRNNPPRPTEPSLPSRLAAAYVDYRAAELERQRVQHETRAAWLSWQQLNDELVELTQVADEARRALDAAILDGVHRDEAA